MGECHMTVKASGRSALLLAAGIYLCFAAPSQAASTAYPSATIVSPNAQSVLVRAAQHQRRLKTAAQIKAGKPAQKSLAGKNPPAAHDGDTAPVIPPSVANANAELTSTLPAGSPGTSASAPVDQPSRPLAAANTPVVAPDQLNDLDREAQPGKPPATSMMMATSETPAASVASGYDESPNKDRASLAGEIFIGIGLLLTLASDARMFMA